MLKNKNAIIFGARSGIGLETVKVFAENNANIYAFIKKNDPEFLETCKDLQKKYNSKIKVYSLDLSNETEIKTKILKFLQEVEQIHIYVNTVAILEFGLSEMFTQERLKKTFQINFFSHILLLQLLVKKMKKNKSSIINFSSSANLKYPVGTSAYASSKAAIETYSKILSKELGRYNIRVNVIQPGMVDTDSMKKTHQKEIILEELKKISLNKIANVRDIANLILFLASENSSHINGEIIKINGGL
jgi:3-oxoacyl-[acyl-carrier protein] reductase